MEQEIPEEKMPSKCNQSLGQWQRLQELGWGGESDFCFEHVFNTPIISRYFPSENWKWRPMM
jgi:hypothetical protein